MRRIQSTQFRCRIRRIFVFFTAMLVVFLSCETFTVFGNSYNDAWALTYRNMVRFEGNKNTVPTLYKNDAVFGNHRRFPLVVQNNIHYVPVEMFTGLVGTRLTYGYSISYFYLATPDGTRYISFDVDNNMVTTHEHETYELETKLFYNTRYLPATEVADVLGIKLEIYENSEDSIYALRLSDTRAKASFSELIRMYSPIKNNGTPDVPPTDTTTPPETTTPTTPSQPDELIPPVTDSETTVPDTDPPTTVKPPVQNEEPAKDPVPAEIGERLITLSFDMSDMSILPDILETLEKDLSGVSCIFFVTPDDVLTYSDSIRQIIAYGHSVGILLGNDSYAYDLEQARENMRLVTKRSVRLVRFTSGSLNVPADDVQYDTFVKQNGLCVWDYNISVGDSSDMYDKMYDKLYDLENDKNTVSAVIRFTPGKNTSDALKRIAKLVAGKKQLSFLPCDETTYNYTDRR